MISRLELWLQDIVLDAIKKHQTLNPNHVTQISAMRDPTPEDNDYNSGTEWYNAKEKTTWINEKKWKKKPKAKRQS